MSEDDDPAFLSGVLLAPLGLLSSSDLLKSESSLSIADEIIFSLISRTLGLGFFSFETLCLFFIFSEDDFSPLLNLSFFPFEELELEEMFKNCAPPLLENSSPRFFLAGTSSSSH